jgi:hypothetical protein
MIDPTAPFAAAQRAALEGSGDLAAAMGLPFAMVFDTLPTNQALPYVVVDLPQVDDDPDACLDGSEIFATVHSWSRPEPPGTSQAVEMAAVIRTLLGAGLVIAGHDVVLAEFISTRFITDPDGSTHAIQTFRYLTAPAI